LSQSVRWAWRRPRWLRCLSGTLVAALLILGGILAYLKLNESELVFRTALSRTRATSQLPSGAERLVIRAADGSELAALILRPQAAHDSAFWILHLHGNADSALSSEQLRHCDSLRELGFSVLSFDYRGFGMSAGVASGQHMNQDAEAALNALIQRGVSPAHIILWGHSLGSGPAVLLASEHPVAALVLFGAFTSIPDAAQDTYPYLPVKWIASIRFASIDLMAKVHIPVFIAHSATDSPDTPTSCATTIRGGQRTQASFGARRGVFRRLRRPCRGTVRSRRAATAGAVGTTRATAGAGRQRGIVNYS
jgi:uncharacterized protein